MSKAILSPGQGLLYLMDYYEFDPIKIDQLKKYYFLGAQNEKELKEIKNILADKALNNYEVSYNDHVINEDPTRRYFETHIAYETLRSNLSSINKEELNEYYNQLVHMLPKDKISQISYVLNGEFRNTDKNPNREYADYISKLKKGEILSKNLSNEEREKLILIVKCAYLGVANASCNKLPLNIYGEGIFRDKNRGKKLVEGQETTRNLNMGIMKGKMPSPGTDIARAESEPTYVRPSEQATYNENSQWAKSNFAQLVHPFSNSISGTMLVQLRVLARLKKDKKTPIVSSAQNIEKHLQLLISAMLFISGGHSLNEYTAPISLPKVKDEFKSIPGFEKISMESMFYQKNETNFNKALEDTIAYNKLIVIRKDLHAQIVGDASIYGEKENNALFYLKVSQNTNQCIHTIEERSEKYNQRINSQFFKFFRSGVAKSEIINQSVALITTYLNERNIESAMDEVSKLKITLETRFGKNNFFGNVCESFKLVELFEKDISFLHQSVLEKNETLPNK